MPTPLEGLMALTGQPTRQIDYNYQSDAEDNTAIKLQALRKARLDEMMRNRDLAANAPVVSPSANPMQTTGRSLAPAGSPGLPSFNTGATPFDVKDLQSDLNEDPSTGLAAHKQVDDTNVANLKAILGGYTGGAPQATPGSAPGSSYTGGDGLMPAQRQAQAERAAEVAKSRIPVETADIQATGQRDVAAMQTGSAQQLAQEATAQKNKEYQEFMQFIQTNPELAKRLTGITTPGDRGAMSFATPMAGGLVPKLPLGKGGTDTLALIKEYETLKNPGYLDFGAKIGQSMGTNTNRMKQIEGILDGTPGMQGWRNTSSQDLQKQLVGAGPQGAAAVPANRMTRPLRDGSTAYSDDGGKTWLKD